MDIVCPINFKPCNYSYNCNKCPLVLEEIDETMNPQEDKDGKD